MIEYTDWAFEVVVNLGREIATRRLKFADSSMKPQHGEESADFLARVAGDAPSAAWEAGELPDDYANRFITNALQDGTLSAPAEVGEDWIG